ncbi:MAG TPA: hypothetical protein VHQ01_13415, partial [Pyrinomonadaceae bacterium]|nr:hypothetical protein [Pyrinomonadaceae bacterium]
MLRRKIIGVLLVYAVLLPTIAFGQTASKIYEAPADVLAKIKDEGTKNSQIMQTLSYLSDVIGPRLTASPGMKRGNDWTRDTLAKWGLQNAHLEAWGPFGRGWTLKRFYAMVNGPTAFPMIAYPKAWSPGTDTLFTQPVAAAVDPKAPKKGKTPPPPPPAAPANQSTAYTAEVVHFNPLKEEDLAQYKGKLKGKIVLLGGVREVPARFEAPGKRSTEKELLDLSNAPDPAAPRPAGGNGRGGFPGGGNQQPGALSPAARFRFLSEEGAAIIVDGARGDGGTIFVSQATAVQPATAAGATPGAPGAAQGPRYYEKGANVPIQVSAAAEHFNRVARMVDAGENVTMTVDLAVEFQDSDPNGYNTVAEIPGTDKA